MRILDLDLDFFVNDIRIEYFNCNGRFNNSTPWTEIQVRRFLEEQCGLTKQKKIPGRIVNQHHEAFYFWRELINEGKLEYPFELVHVDAHSDMGFGDSICRDYIMGNLLHRPVDERIEPDDTTIGCGNYIVFAVACRWLNSITFVTHPKWYDDLSRFHFKNYNTSSGVVQLKKYDNPESIDFSMSNLPDPIKLEPEVPFSSVEKKAYFNNKDFSYIVLSHSPEYTPQSADSLLDIFREYIEEI